MCSLSQNSLVNLNIEIRGIKFNDCFRRIKKSRRMAGAVGSTIYLNILNAICNQWLAYQCSIYVNAVLFVGLIFCAEQLYILAQRFTKLLDYCDHNFLNGKSKCSFPIVEYFICQYNDQGFRYISPQMNFYRMLFILICNFSILYINFETSIFVHAQHPNNLQITIFFLESAQPFIISILPIKRYH